MRLLRYQPSTRGCVVNLQYRLEGIAPSQAQRLFHHVLLVDCKCVGLRKPLSVHTAVGNLTPTYPEIHRLGGKTVPGISPRARERGALHPL